MTVPGRDDDIDAVPALITSVLDTIVGRFEAAGVNLPARRYVAQGGVAADCEQLTVTFLQVYAGAPGEDPNKPQQCDGPRSASLVVQLFRCAPAGQRGAPPTPDQISAAALQSMRDSWLLLDAAADVDRRGWNIGVIAEVTANEPAGGYASVTMTITLQVP